ncbi:hypothetical protein [Saccharicrinis aurantiacus]|uniref:hypothetical protein n=1 Tax=Saccharicrinis aurantiacus TaxID=1849719 RepID=UPI0008392EE9|nr:hypothetical protein [Saccharicrinis aurantiacus]
MKRQLISKVLAICAILTVYSSCNLDDFDLEKMADPSFNLGLKAPIASGSYTMGQIIDNIDDPDSLIIVDNEGLFRISYVDDNIFTFHAFELVNIPSILTPNDFEIGINDLVGTSLPDGGVYITIKDAEPFIEEKEHTVDVGNEGNDEDIFLSEMIIGSSDFIVKLTTSINSPMSAVITLDNCYKNGVPVTCTLTDSEPTKTISLAGSTIDFTQSNKENLLLYSTSVRLEDNDNAYIESTDWVNINLTLTDIHPEYIEGDFGQKTIDIDPEVLDFTSEIFESLGGNIILENPIFKLNISNSIGVPSAVDFQLSADTKDETSVLLNPSNINIEIPSEVGENTTVENIIDRTNSDIIEFVSSLPVDSIKYFGDIEMNKEGRVNTNFVTDESMISIDLEMDLPLEITVESMGIQDTIPMDALDMEVSLDNTSLWINANNSIPLTISSEIIFIDTDNKALSRRIKLTDFAAAKADKNGNTIEAVNSEIQIELSADDMINILEANSMVFDARFQSPEDGKSPARLKEEYQLDIEMKLETRATLN